KGMSGISDTSIAAGTRSANLYSFAVIHCSRAGFSVLFDEDPVLQMWVSEKRFGREESGDAFIAGERGLNWTKKPILTVSPASGIRFARSGNLGFKTPDAKSTAPAARSHSAAIPPESPMRGPAGRMPRRRNPAGR